MPVLQGRPLYQVVVELPDLTSVQADVWKERDAYHKNNRHSHAPSENQIHKVRK